MGSFIFLILLGLVGYTVFSDGSGGVIDSEDSANDNFTNDGYSHYGIDSDDPESDLNDADYGGFVSYDNSFDYDDNPDFDSSRYDSPSSYESDDNDGY
jgi:hypothetical protein